MTDPKSRFSELYVPEPNTGCWLWLGAVGRWGYGIFRNKKAHRFSWMMHRGPIPDGLFVCHKCDVTCCVNPDHLWLGTHRQNMDDMARKGRAAKGSKQGASRLTESQVLAIREDPRPLRALAKAYGVGKCTVQDIRNRRSWAWLP